VCTRCRWVSWCMTMRSRLIMGMKIIIRSRNSGRSSACRAFGTLAMSFRYFGALAVSKFFAAFLTTASGCWRRVLGRIEIGNPPGGGRSNITCYGCFQKAAPVRRPRQIRFRRGLGGSWGGSKIFCGVKRADSKILEPIGAGNGEKGTSNVT